MPKKAELMIPFYKGAPKTHLGYWDRDNKELDWRKNEPFEASVTITKLVARGSYWTEVNTAAGETYTAYMFRRTLLRSLPYFDRGKLQGWFRFQNRGGKLGIQYLVRKEVFVAP